ncbi:unnamed protein product [Caenorhabditis auriculariae]|uniref:Uncharacterized protein n=1 Tax=Caenorhabditis auriculariae TaxID=2777116 RepID=A0A8S1H5H5_9PELO|nr:unnamed protein product [Caenorhabditis auriculariae]
MISHLRSWDGKVLGSSAIYKRSPRTSVLTKILVMFVSSSRLVGQLSEQIIFAELQQQLDAAEQKRQLQREWLDRLWGLYSSCHEVLAEFRRLVFQFVQLVVVPAGLPVSSEVINCLKDLTKCVQKKLDLCNRLLEHEATELSRLFSKFGSAFILDAQKNCHLIGLESSQLSKELEDFAELCNTGTIMATSMDLLKNRVADFRTATFLAPSWEKLYAAVKF